MSVSGQTRLALRTNFLCSASYTDIRAAHTPVHSVRASSLVCGTFCVLALSSNAFAAAPQWIELSWNATDDCSSAADVLRSVDSQLGDQFVSRTRIQARGDLRMQERGEYELQLEYTTDSGARDQRSIRGESCQAVSEAAALVLALALDPTHALAQEPRAEPRSAEADSGETTEFLLGVLALFDTPVMSVPTVGAGLRLGFRYGVLELNASVQLFLPREPTTNGISMQLSYWSVDVGACYLARVATWSIGPCARFELGQLTGNPRGELETANAGSERVHVATLAAAARVPIVGAFHVQADAGFEWVARRPQFEVTGPGIIASPALFGVRVVAGAFLAF
jgi:hypothetical protein